MRASLAALTATAGLAAALSIAPAQAAPAQSAPAERLLETLATAGAPEAYAQYYGPRRYYGGPRGYYGPRAYRRGYGYGGAAAGAAAGLAAGALLGAAIAAQPAQAAPPPPATVDPQVAAYCARRYRSFDPVSGTFLANDGQRYVCTYP